MGPGDSGKTTILDAIDLCLGARRNVSFSDTDFFGLDVTQPISITLTLGSLPDALRTMETYGNYLQAFNSATGQIQEEPQLGLETVLCLRLSVDSELEPNRRNGWFKSVTRYEDVAHDILGPHLPASDAGFQALISRLYWWAHAA
ncbi:hypothetical protein ACFDC3_07725 [Escherichia coli]